MRVEFDDLHVPIAVAGQLERLGERAHALDRGVHLRRIADHERKPPAGRRKITDVDPGIAPQLRRNFVLLALEPLLQRIPHVGFEEQVAATGEVEPEADAIMGQPLRPIIIAAFRR